MALTNKQLRIVRLAREQLAAPPNEDLFMEMLLSLKDDVGDILPLPRAKRFLAALAELERQKRHADLTTAAAAEATPIAAGDLG